MAGSVRENILAIRQRIIGADSVVPEACQRQETQSWPGNREVSGAAAEFHEKTRKHSASAQLSGWRFSAASSRACSFERRFGSLVVATSQTMV